MDQINDGDWIIQYSSQTNDYCITRQNYNGFFESDTIDNALRKINEINNERKYFPNIFFINDHGNINQINVTID